MENIVNKEVKILEASISDMIGKIATVLYDGGDIDIIVGFFCEGVQTNYELEYFVNEYPGLKATWWFAHRGLELANSFTHTKFR